MEIAAQGPGPGQAIFRLFCITRAQAAASGSRQGCWPGSAAKDRGVCQQGEGAAGCAWGVPQRGTQWGPPGAYTRLGCQSSRLRTEMSSSRGMGAGRRAWAPLALHRLVEQHVTFFLPT